MAYHEVPLDVLENAPELVEWARQAIRVAAEMMGSNENAGTARLTAAET